MKISNALKKTCGEELARFISLNFNQDIATTTIKKLFNNNGKDAKYIKPSEFTTLKKLLNYKTQEQYNEVTLDRTVTATELLNDNGYDLIPVNSNNQAKKFKKYFRHDEKLCKFNSTAVYKETEVFFIVKHDAGKIMPSDNPSRQDKYSTSVMSVKVSKNGRNVLQITSRYNHTVSGCDNTFNSNLDSIIDGLSDAFNKEFNFKIKRTSAMFEFENFVDIDDTFVYYHREIDGIKIGDNTLITDKILSYSYDRYYTYLEYIIDLKTKKIVWDGIFELKDGFVEYFNRVVEKIEFVKDINSVVDDKSDKICYIQK